MADKDQVEVEVTQRDASASDKPGSWDAVVKDGSRSRAWSGNGSTPGAASTEAVRGFLGDRRSAEYVK